MNHDFTNFGFRTIYTESGIAFEDKSAKQPLNTVDVVDSIYSPEYRGIPYLDEEYNQDWMAFISLCLIVATSYKFYCSQLASGSLPNLPHTSMSLDEALNHIGCYPFDPQSPEIWSELLNGAYSHIESREIATKNTKILPRPMQLARSLNLSEFAYFSMHCAIVCKLDVGFERVFKVLQCDKSGNAPTLGVIHTLYAFAFPYKKAEWLLDCSSLENRLLFNLISEFDLKRSLTLRPYAFSYILGEFCMRQELSSCMIQFPVNNQKPLHIDRQLQEVRNSIKTMLSQAEPCLSILSGVAGSGKKTTLQHLAKEEGILFLLVDLDKELSNDQYTFSNILERA